MSLGKSVDRHDAAVLTEGARGCRMMLRTDRERTRSGRARVSDAPPCDRHAIVRSARTHKAEHDGVLECLGCALAHTGGRSVCRVAEQDDAVLAPVRERAEVVHVVAQDRRLVRGLEDRGDRLVPAAEAPPELRLAPIGLVRLPLRRVLCGKPVGPAMPDVHEAEALTDAPGLGQAPGVDGHRRDAPPCRIARVAGPRVDDRAPDA